MYTLIPNWQDLKLECCICHTDRSVKYTRNEETYCNICIAKIDEIGDLVKSLKTNRIYVIISKFNETDSIIAKDTYGLIDPNPEL